MKPHPVFSVSLSLCMLLLIPVAQAADRKPKVDFIRDVKPILEFNCVACHWEKKDKGKLRLDTRALAFDFDDLIDPGNPDDSSIYWTTTLEADDDDVMPPQDEDHEYLLPEVEQEILKQWIVDGAIWPDNVTLEPRKRLPKKIEFVTHVQPILEMACVKCHNEEKDKGDLRLDVKSEALKFDGLINPGDPHDSSIWWTTVLPPDDDLLMPPSKEPPMSPHRNRHAATLGGTGGRMAGRHRIAAAQTG